MVVFLDKMSQSHDIDNFVIALNYFCADTRLGLKHLIICHININLIYQNLKVVKFNYQNGNICMFGPFIKLKLRSYNFLRF